MRTRCGSSCTSGSSLRTDDAFGGCRSGPAASSCPVVSNPARLSSIHSVQPCFGNNAVEVGGGSGGLHSVLVNRSISGNTGLTVSASPAVKAGGPLSSLTGLKSTDTPPRETYPQRVQVTGRCYFRIYFVHLY
jgi:hypothetical protein